MTSRGARSGGLKFAPTIPSHALDLMTRGVFAATDLSRPDQGGGPKGPPYTNRQGFARPCGGVVYGPRFSSATIICEDLPLR